MDYRMSLLLKNVEIKTGLLQNCVTSLLQCISALCFVSFVVQGPIFHNGRARLQLELSRSMDSTLMLGHLLQRFHQFLAVLEAQFSVGRLVYMERGKKELYEGSHFYPAYLHFGS